MWHMMPERSSRSSKLDDNMLASSLIVAAIAVFLEHPGVLHGCGSFPCIKQSFSDLLHFQQSLFLNLVESVFLFDPMVVPHMPGL